MKRTLAIIAAGAILVGCGNQNTLGIGNYTYNYITCNSDYIDLQDVRVKSWKDFDGEQIEVTLEDGNNLLVSSNSCFLSREKIGAE